MSDETLNNIIHDPFDAILVVYDGVETRMDLRLLIGRFGQNHSVHKMVEIHAAVHLSVKLEECRRFPLKGRYTWTEMEEVYHNE
ncbi:MAG: hypothetical protein NTY46_06195 [Candidatus Sumerlaeota bacterium]|nr:hypothetical protein [Candidatus Sumerlaeota bacterium]